MAINQYEDMIMSEQETSVTPAAPTAPPANKYEELAQGDTRSQVSAIAQSMNYAVEKEPSRMVKALKMAQEVGLDVGTVDRNMEKIEKKKTIAGVDYEAMIRDTPGVAKFMETPENAALGREDMEAMGKIDKAARFIPKVEMPNPITQAAQGTGAFAKDMHQAGESGWNSLTSNLLGLQMVFNGADRDMIEMQAMANKRAQQLADARPEYSKEFNAAMSEEGGDVTKAWKQMTLGYDQWREGKTIEALKNFIVGDVTLVAETLDFLRHVAKRPKGLMYSVSENAVNALPSIGLGGAGLMAGPGAFVAVPVGVGTGSAITEVGATMNSILQEKGIDITDPNQLEAAYRNPQIMSDVRSQALKKGLTLGVIDGLSAAFGGRLLRGAGAGATKTQKVIAAAKGTGFEMATEAGGEAASQAVQKGDIRQVDVGSAIQEGFTSLGQSAVTASQTAAVRGEFAIREMLDKDPVKATHQVVQSTDQAIVAMQGAEALQQLGVAIKETKNLQQVPGKIGELVEAATGGKGATSVYFQTDEFDNYWSKKGESPAQKAGEIMGDGGKAYEQAKNSTGLIEIPLEQFASSLGVTEDFEGMLPITRTQADGMTLEEARETMVQLPSVMKQLALEATRTQERRQSRGQTVDQRLETRQILMQQELGRSLTDEEIAGIQQEVNREVVQERAGMIGAGLQDQLVAAGRPIREAKYAAELVQSSFGNVAQRMGFSPDQFDQFITDYLPTIQRADAPAVAQPGEQILNQTQEQMGPQVSPLGFYSQVEAEVQKMDFKQMPGKDLSGRIKNIAGIKKEELEFLGLNEWLETQEGKVTKEDVVNFIRNKGLAVEQIVQGDIGDAGGNAVEWNDKERDTSYDDDEISNEMDYYLNDNKEWREENEATLRAEYLEEYTDEDGNVDESGLSDKIEDELRDLAEKTVTEYVQSDDYHNARFSVEGTAYDQDGDEVNLRLEGNDESGWYSDTTEKHYEGDLNEVKIQLLGQLREEGKIAIDEATLKRAEDISWRYANAKMPTRATLDKKIRALAKTDYDRLLKKAQDENHWHLAEDYVKDKDEKQLKAHYKEVVQDMARDEINESYENPDNKKNTITTSIDHPLIEGDISGNNVNGWTLTVRGDTEDGATPINEFKLDAKTLDDAKVEAIQKMIDAKIVMPKPEGTEQNKPTRAGRFDQYVAPGESSNYREFLLTLPQVDGTFKYTTHFDQKNIVAHARVTDRVDTEGKKVLFIEEIQSDWHQQGRDRGYKGQDGMTEEQRSEKVSVLANRIREIEEESDALSVQKQEIVHTKMADLEESIPETMTLSDFENSKEAEFRGGMATVYFGIKGVDYIDASDVEFRINSPEVIESENVSKYEIRVDGRLRAEFGGALEADALAEFVKIYKGNITANAVKRQLNDTDLRDYNDKIDALTQERREINEEKERVSGRNQVPDAPLKNTESWAALVMKRMMRVAVEEGYDKLAWSPASFQVDRWGTDDVTWVRKTRELKVVEENGNYKVMEVDPKDGNTYSSPYASGLTKEEAEAMVKNDSTYFLVGSVEQRGGNAAGTDIEALARMRGELLERRGETVTNKEELLKVVQSTLGRERTAKDLENLTNNIWEQMQIKETGQKAPRKEGMEFFYDNVLPKKVASALLKKIDKDAKVTTTKIRTQSGGLVPTRYEGPTLTLEQVKEVRARAVNDDNTSAGMIVALNDLEGAMIRGDEFSELANELSPAVAEYIGGKLVEDTAKSTPQVWAIPLTDAIKGKTMEGFALFQGDPNSPIGQIRFGETGINIDLLEGANPSTFLHEMGHAYMKIMRDLSAKEEAPQQIKDDFKTVLEWLGAEGPELTVEQEEKFARGFEAYLREGKAPSSALKKAFVNFKSWLMVVYKSLTNLRVELTPAVTDVFDRLIATEVEIAEARGFISSEFNINAVDAPTEQQAKYLEKVAEWKQESEEKLARKLMADYDKKSTKEYKALEELTRANVESEANQMKIYNLMAYLEKGTKADGSEIDSNTPKFRIDKQAIRDNFPKGTLNAIRKFTADAGGDYAVADPSVIAAMFGYNSGRDMVSALSNTPTKESFIDSMTDQRMNESFPDLMADEGMLFSEAMKIVHEDKGAVVKRMELDMIAKKAMPTLKEGIRQVARRMPPNSQIKAEAMRTIKQTNQDSVRPIVYLRAERKFAKQAGILLSRGDFEGAFDAKRKELYNYELYRAATQFNDQKIKKLKFFKKVMNAKDEDTAKVRDNNIVKATKALIARYLGGDLQRHPMEHLHLIKKYDEDAYNAMEALIEGVMIPKETFNDMTAEEFMNVADVVQSLWDFSKTSKEIIVGGQKIELDKAIDEIIASVRVFQTKTQEKQYASTATDREKTNIDLMGLVAAFTRFETIADIMGDKYREYIFTEPSRAEDERAALAKMYKEKVVNLSKPIAAGIDFKKKIRADEIGFEFKDLSEVLGALYHTGNESNMQKLLLGRGWATQDEATGIIDTSKWDALVDRLIAEGTLRKEHFDYIQSMWDINEELKPRSQKSFKRIFGYFFDEITAKPFTNKFGTYRGGYAPAKIDPHAVNDIFQRQELENFIKSNPTYEWPASGGRGFTMKRVDSFNKPLSLDLGLAVRHIDESIRFAVVKPAVVDSAKIIMNQRFREELAAINPKFVNDLDKIVKPALNRADKGMAKVDDPSTPPILMRGFRMLQRNAAMQIMVGNVVNTLEQLAGPVVAMSRVDAKYMFKGLMKYMTSPKKTARQIEELSPFMRNRNDTSLFEMEKQAKRIFEEQSNLETMREFANKHGYFLQSFTQQIVDNMVWAGSYDQAISQGMGPDAAVNKADSDVRMTQGGRRAIDISAIESNQWLQFFQMFMGFFNMMSNLQLSNFTKLYYEDMGMTKKYAKGMYLYATGFASVAIISGAVRKIAAGGFDADDDDEYLDDMYDIFIGSQIDLGLALIPVAGSAVKAGLNQVNDKQYDDRVSASPAITAITTVIGTGSKAATGQLFDDKRQKQDVRDALTALGILTGMPTGSLTRPISYEIDRQSGKARPTGPIDAARGYVTGKPGVRD